MHEPILDHATSFPWSVRPPRPPSASQLLPLHRAPNLAYVAAANERPGLELERAAVHRRRTWSIVYCPASATHSCSCRPREMRLGQSFCVRPKTPWCTCAARARSRVSSLRSAETCKSCSAARDNICHMISQQLPCLRPRSIDPTAAATQLLFIGIVVI